MMVVGQSHDKSRKEVVLSIAHCGPIAEIVSRKLLSLFVGNSKSKSSKAQNVRVASVRSFGDDVASVDAFLEEEEEECEDENETLRLAVVVVETVENDDIAREGMALVKRLCRAAKEEDQEEHRDDGGQQNEEKKKKKRKKRKYVLVGVGDSNVLEDRRYFRSNQNSAEECNAAARCVDKLLEKSGKWERAGKRVELDYGRDYERKLERWVEMRKRDLFFLNDDDDDDV